MTWLHVRRLLAWPAIAAIGAVAAALWFLIAFRPEHGIPGVLQIVAPHLALAALALVPLTLLDRRRAGAIAVAALAPARRRADSSANKGEAARPPAAARPPTAACLRNSRRVFNIVAFM